MKPPSQPDTPARTPDGRYVVIAGRRWRATNPMLPELRRRELVDELMAARRAVGAAMRAEDWAAERTARGRVHEAKLALGERGPAWWERIEDAIRALVDERGPDRTACPSEVARLFVGADRLRELMPHVREAAARLAERGEIAVTQRGEAVDARTARGPIRLASAGRPSPAADPRPRDADRREPSG